MNRDKFFKHFHPLTDQQDAVAKMRELVLELAIRGQLVEQIVAEEKDATWQKFIRPFEGKQNGEELPPFHIPKQWCWARLDDVADYGAARKVEPSEISNKAWVLDLEEIEKNSGRLLRFTTFKEKQSSSNKAEFVVDDVLYGKLRPYLNKVLVAPKAGFCTTEIVPIRSRGMIVPTYLCLFLRSPHFVGYTNTKSYGMKMPRLGTEDAVRAWIAVPPPAEQRRIVAKADELMVLCDELEQQQQTRHDACTQLQQSALHHLLAARDPHTFAPAWQRVRDQFHLLHDTPDAIPQLRQAINTLAVQGLLLPQSVKDGDAAESLNRLRQQKIELVKKKILPKPADVTPIDESSVPFELPINWTWIRFGELNRKLEYGTSQKAFSNANGVPTFRMNNILGGKLLDDKLKYVPASCPNLPKLFLDDGDILFNRTNSAELVGKAAVFKGESGKFTFASYLIRAVVFQEFALPEFFNLAINSQYFRQTQIEPELTQQCGQANFNGTKLANTIVPFPPLAEQRRIVARVEELMQQCDALEAQLTQAQTLGSRLLDATLHHILAA